MEGFSVMRDFVKTGVLAAAVLACGIAGAGEFVGAGCRVTWDESRLTVGNGLFCREYVSVGGVLRTPSLRDDKGREILRPYFSKKWDSLTVAAERAKWSPVGVEGVRVTVKAGGVETELDLYPGVAGVLERRPAIDGLASVHDIGRDIMQIREDARALKAENDRNEVLRFAAPHLRVTAMTCVDQTDARDNVLDVNERLMMPTYDAPYSVGCSLLDCRDLLTGSGLVFMRLAPMPVCRPGRPDDFIVHGGDRSVTTLANGYPLATLAYAGGDAGRQRAVVAFQRALRPYRPGRDGVLLSNTWGAGNRDSRICEDFLLKEIEAGARIGVDVIQIDDGWQRGRTQNSKKKVAAGQKKVWSGYWATDPDFWKEDLERFPQGLDFLVRRAAEKGMRFGIWFGPDSSDDAANWEKDAACLLDYHRRLGIDYFKMDSLKLHSPTAFARNRQMFDRMLTESDGAMVFDLDCTAEVRPGFLGLMDIGPIFVENRSTWRHGYYPHHTLKNLWDLSHVVDPIRMRFEFNNPDTNHEKYADSPLGHGNYRPDALFATVMAASPLAWMELSDVTEKSVAALAPLVKTWKAERARWHGGVIHPVASRPDGVAWTGFLSEAPDGKGGYVLLFRELNEKSACALDLAPWFATCPTAATVIGGRGTGRLEGSVLRVEIPEKLDFLWLKLD